MRTVTITGLGRIHQSPSYGPEYVVRVDDGVSLKGSETVWLSHDWDVAYREYLRRGGKPLSRQEVRRIQDEEQRHHRQYA